MGRLIPMSSLRRQDCRLQVKRTVDQIPSIYGLKVSFIAVDELLKYVHLLPAEFGVFSGAIFNLAAAAQCEGRTISYPANC